MCQVAFKSSERFRKHRSTCSTLSHLVLRHFDCSLLVETYVVGGDRWFYTELYDVAVGIIKSLQVLGWTKILSHQIQTHESPRMDSNDNLNYYLSKNTIGIHNFYIRKSVFCF